MGVLSWVSSLTMVLGGGWGGGSKAGDSAPESDFLSSSCSLWRSSRLWPKRNACGFCVDELEGTTSGMCTERVSSMSGSSIPAGSLLSTGNLGSDSVQVWSLIQFYSVDFSQSRIGVNKCVFYKRTIKVCVSCCWWCPGTSATSAPHLMVSLYLWCSEAAHEASWGPLKSAVSVQKALQGSETETRELLGGTE